MGNLVKETPYSEITATVEVLDKLGVRRKGLTTFRKASPDVQQRVVDLMVFGSDLIHGLFLPPDQQLALTRQRNQERGPEFGWNFTEEDFAKLGEPPAWPEERRCAVVLDISLDTIGRTFDEGRYHAIQAQRELSAGGCCWDEIKSGTSHLRLIEGIEFHSNTLQWRVVDLEANWKDKNKDPRLYDIRFRFIHSAGLWLAGYSPRWIQAMDGENVPFIWLAGYELSIPGYVSWTHMPYLKWICVSRVVQLFASPFDRTGAYWSVPVFRE